MSATCTRTVPSEVETAVAQLDPIRAMALLGECGPDRGGVVCAGRCGWLGIPWPLVDALKIAAPGGAGDIDAWKLADLLRRTHLPDFRCFDSDVETQADYTLDLKAAMCAALSAKWNARKAVGAVTPNN